ncbi:DnaJ domain-containing protein [Nitrosopumilus sp. K4]|uniref:DnaJ domain-containing protein n=1 Tax=Nitrosopumilus sp. K4 TaxID=2795383 RepID=UPI001BA99234|nr:DnaJ domain-containing protein [Nitrosopumilus sp. K4]QUC65309.1 DnaJ domain-containing protein [Nitrosopumilus sp. K4]
MKKISSAIIVVLLVSSTSIVFAQNNESKELQMELIVSDEEKIILFIGFTIAVIALFLYLARDIILRRKTSYDSEDMESKKDKTYEKYHSDWSDDYEDLGKRKNTKEDKEFREALENSELPDYYEVLEISQDATQEEIKKQYRALAKKLHPDKTKEKQTEEIMIKINEAYEVLSNQELREKYDKYFKSR